MKRPSIVSLAKWFIPMAIVLALSIAADSALAQMRIGGSSPMVLSPRPATPVQNSGHGTNQNPRPMLNMSLVDPGPIGAETTTNIFFPQVAVGGGYSTIFTLMNTGSTTTTGTLTLTGQDGNPLSVNMNSASVHPSIGGPNDRIEVVGSSIPVTVAAGGTQFVTATALSTADPTKNAWARVQNIGGSLGGVGTFQLTNSSGSVTSIAGVLASQPLSVATIPVNDDGVNLTGFAVANPGISNVNIRLYTLNTNGQIVDSLIPAALNPLGPQKQFAGFLFQQRNNQTIFKGSMVLVAQSGQTFSVVALLLNGPLLSTIPVIPEKAPQVPN